MYLVNVIISSIVSVLGSFLFITKISKTNISKNNKFTKIIIYFFLNVIFALNLIFFSDINKVLLNFFIVLIMGLSIIFNYNYQKSIYYTIIYYLCGLFVEFFITIIYGLLFYLNIINLKQTMGTTMFFSIIDSLLVISLANNKKISNFFQRIFEKLKDQTKNFIVLLFILIYLILLCFNNYIKFGKNIDYLINIGMFIFIIISLIFIIKNTIKRQKFESEYELLQKNLLMYEKEVNRQGKKNHEYNNQLMVLRGYINNPKKLEEYLDLLVEQHKGGQNFRIKQLSYLPDGGFKGLIYSKLALMEDNEIKSYLFVSSELKNLLENIDIKYYNNLTKIFGVFIDNAIDACKEATKKEIVLDIKVDNNYLIIEISNTFNNNLDVKKIGKKGYSSKGLGHGFGLSIVNDIKNSNQFIDTFNEIEDEMFKQTIVAKIK